MARLKRMTFKEALAYCDKNPQYAVRDKRRHKYKRFGQHVYKLPWGKRLWSRWKRRSDRAGLGPRYGPFKLEQVEIPFYLLWKLIPDWPADKAHFSQRFRNTNVRVTNYHGDIVISGRDMSITLKQGVNPDEAIDEAQYLLDLIRRKSFGFNFYRKKNPLTPQ